MTDRNGRYVLMVRAEHRGAIPGIVHGASASGASLFLEPLETVEINNDIVALEEQEDEEVRRILLELTDAFRDRPDDLERTLDVATELDVVQARGRFSQLVAAVEPAIAHDGAFELRGARHPLLIAGVTERLTSHGGSGIARSPGFRIAHPRSRSRRHPPRAAGPGARDRRAQHRRKDGRAQDGRPACRDGAGRLAHPGRQGFAASGLSVGLCRHRRRTVDLREPQHVLGSRHQRRRDGPPLPLPALVLLDEVGAGTDPVEGGALGIAVIDHFRQRGAHLIATTHYDALKSYASTTEGVAGAAFGFNPETFAPTYRLLYGSPGRSLAIEIAARLGMPPSVITSARDNLTEPQKQLADHLARMDEDLRRLEEERRPSSARARHGRRGGADAAAREESVRRARRTTAPPSRREAGRSASRRAPRDRRRDRRPEVAGRGAVGTRGGSAECGRQGPGRGLNTGDIGARGATRARRWTGSSSGLRGSDRRAAGVSVRRAAPTDRAGHAGQRRRARAGGHRHRAARQTRRSERPRQAAARGGERPADDWPAVACVERSESAVDLQPREGSVWS